MIIGYTLLILFLICFAIEGRISNMHQDYVRQEVAAQATVRETETVRPTDTPEPVYTVLSVGDRGDEVCKLQRRLNHLGYDAGTEDGIFGSKTQAAVKAFQRRAGFSEDGIADQDTQLLLYKYAAPFAANPTSKTIKSPFSPSDPVLKSAPKPTPTPTQEPLVIITRTGKCYHRRNDCGNIKYWERVPLSEAEQRGLRKCMNCW